MEFLRPIQHSPSGTELVSQQGNVLAESLFLGGMVESPTTYLINPNGWEVRLTELARATKPNSGPKKSAPNGLVVPGISYEVKFEWNYSVFDTFHDIWKKTFS